MQSRTVSSQVIQAWEQRQKKDGGLVAALAIISIIPAVRFLCSPDTASACVLIVFLVALLFAIFRLIQTARTLVNLTPSSVSRSVPERAQIMEGSENPADYGAVQVQSVAGCWMSSHYTAQGTDSHPLGRHSLN